MVKKTSETVKHQQIRPRNLSGCCLHGVCTSGICFAETLLAEAGVEKTPSQWNGVLVSKRRSLVSKKGKNTSQTGKQFRKYFYCFCLAEALLAEAEVEKTPPRSTVLLLISTGSVQMSQNLVSCNTVFLTQERNMKTAQSIPLWSRQRNAI